MRPRKPRKSHTPTDADRQFRQALGLRIRALREERYSQEEFADLIDVYRTHVSTIENGRTDLRLSTLRRIAVALQLPLSVLMAPLDETAEPSKLSSA